MHDLTKWLEAGGGASLRAALRGGPPQLREVKLKVTSRCNLRCQMCSYWETRSEEALTLEQWRGVLDQLPALGCEKVHVSGGEPFLRRDLVELLEHARGLGLKVNLTTNGTLCTREQIERLVAVKLNAISISLDGPTAALHDRIRGREGAFRRSLETIAWLREARGERGKPKLRINFVLMPENYKRAAQMVDLAADLGATDLVPMPVDHEEPGRRLSRSQLETYVTRVAPAVAERRAARGFPLDPERIQPFGTDARDLDYAARGRYARGLHERQPCYAPWLHSFFAWNGEVFLCCMTTQAMAPLGDLRRERVADVFSGPRYAEVREAFLRGVVHPHCHRCDLFRAENLLLEPERARPRGRPLELARSPDAPRPE